MTKKTYFTIFVENFYMGLAKKNKLILHGSFREFDMGEFKSIKSAKDFVKHINWEKPYSILLIK